MFVYVNLLKSKWKFTQMSLNDRLSLDLIFMENWVFELKLIGSPQIILILRSASRSSSAQWIIILRMYLHLFHNLQIIDTFHNNLYN